MEYFEKVFTIRWLIQAMYFVHHKKSLPLMLGVFLFLVEVLRASVVLSTFPGWVLSAMSCACSWITIPSLLASSSSSTCVTLTLLLSLVDWVLSSMPCACSRITISSLLAPSSSPSNSCSWATITLLLSLVDSSSSRLNLSALFLSLLVWCKPVCLFSGSVSGSLFFFLLKTQIFWYFMACCWVNSS